MAEVARRFTFGERRPEENPVRQDLMEGLAETRVRINQAYSCFNSTSDPDLIESYVFEINALQARYSYLLRRVREEEAPREEESSLCPL